MNERKAIIPMLEYKQFENNKKELEAFKSGSQFISKITMDAYSNRIGYDIINPDEAIKALNDQIKREVEDYKTINTKVHEFGSLVNKLKRNWVFNIFFYSLFKKYDPWNS